MNFTYDEKVCRRIKHLHENGKSTTEILSVIKAVHGDHPQLKVLTIKYLRHVFGVDLVEILPLNGWIGYGGELSDQKVNSLVNLPPN